MPHRTHKCTNTLYDGPGPRLIKKDFTVSQKLRHTALNFFPVALYKKFIFWFILPTAGHR